FITLTAGQFTIGSDGSYSATNVDVFFGDGPYHVGNSPNGAVNPDAIGLLIHASTFQAVKESNGTFAITASGLAEMIGIDGLTLAGSVTVKINTTGLPVLGFTSGAYIEEVDVTGFDLSAGGIINLKGDASFVLHPNGRVDVDIPKAQLGISVPINGTLTPVFALDGDGQFSFGGGTGFQLDSLQLNGVSIFNGQGGLATLSIALPTTVAAPKADLMLPWEGDVMDVTKLNSQGYI